MGNNVLALFDFDGTVTKKDSFLVFIRFYVTKWKLFQGVFILSPIFIAYKLKLISNEKAKKGFVKYFFGGEDELEFDRKCNIFGNTVLPKILRKSALTNLIQHKKQGHKVIIVSASLENYLIDWCKNNDFELIATKLETSNGLITGNFSSKNCYGKEKVERIHSHINLADYLEIYAYGDTKGDLPMLELATKPFYKFFKD
jgi:phosphatidylglycerophosphatase C